MTSAAARPLVTSFTAAAIASITAGAFARIEPPGGDRRGNISGRTGKPVANAAAASSGAAIGTIGTRVRAPPRGRSSRAGSSIGEERPQGRALAPEPRLERDLAADPGGLSRGQCQRQRHSLMSM